MRVWDDHPVYGSCGEMKEQYDVVIIGGGIAGISAALTCVNRGKTVAVIANDVSTSSLYKAEKVTNYPGIIAASGKELGDTLLRQLDESKAELIRGRALNVMPIGKLFGVAVGSEFCMCASVIIAAGITRERLYPGEGEYLGRGVSYCATCDGMLYKGKTVAVIGGSEEAVRDADFLESLGCTVLRFPKMLRYEIRGTLKADTVVAGSEEYSVDGVFIIKDTISVTKLVQGLDYSDGAIVTDKRMQTTVPGVFAAGDCTGKPYQLAKAAGEGNIAALSACEYIDNLKKEN